MKSALLLLIPALAWAQGDLLRRGEEVFNTNCATGYCHGSKGGVGGAPRLAARGFDQAFISQTVRSGVPNTAMRSFSNLPPADLAAVIAYVATLNGLTPPGPVALFPANLAQAPPLSANAAHGRDLFRDALRGFGRCSTCHEAGGVGIPVTTPIRLPENAAALKSLATPHVSTVTSAGESMPALIVAKKAQVLQYYDLTSAPPVLRTDPVNTVQTRDGSSWQHSSVIGSYSDQELDAIIDYLRATSKF